MARNKQKTWQVYFDLDVPRKDQPRRRRPGKEYPIHQAFFWGGAEWRIPAVYACAQGLVADFVRRVPVGRIREFADRHGLRPDEDRYDFTREERMRLDAQNRAVEDKAWWAIGKLKITACTADNPLLNALSHGLGKDRLIWRQIEKRMKE